MEDIKRAYAWQEAMELSKRLVEVCEAFSDPNTNVLVWHLRQAVVDLPASIAADLQAQRMATMEPAIKLAAELELVAMIYPAIDGTYAEEQLEVVLKRMQAHDFAEREVDPNAEADETEVSDIAEAPISASGEATTDEVPQPTGGTLVSPRADSVGSHPAVISIKPSSE